MKVSISLPPDAALNLYVRIEDLRESKSRPSMGEIQLPVNYIGGSRVIYIYVCDLNALAGRAGCMKLEAKVFYD